MVMVVVVVVVMDITNLVFSVNDETFTLRSLRSLV